jgi:heme-degrading monooxygenase HmoA
MQATFSLWDSGKAMQDFAYKSKYHKEVVQLTRDRNWYKEEMFARFQVIDERTEGNKD